MPRCSLCHCYSSRSCPEGLPNHGDTKGGPSCTFNSQGRHYRDPADVRNPTCDYETRGAKCTFFANDEFANIPYPEDISVGPISESPLNAGGDMSTLLDLLREQKSATDRQTDALRVQMDSLQSQVSNLLQNRADNSASVSLPYLVNTTQSQTPVFSSPPTFSTPATIPHVVASTAPPTFSIPGTVPHVVASAAANLTAALQTGLGHHHNYGYSGLTMDSLRSNPGLVSQAADVLAAATQNVPPLQGMGQAVGSLQTNQVSQTINSVSDLYAATKIKRELRAYEFASTGQFPYRAQLKQDNVNAVSFAFGAFKQLEACKSGLIKNVSDIEFLARLRHLKNVFEIVCLSSNLTSYCDPSWQIAREYDARVVSDIEAGVKSWETLSGSIQPDSIYCAKETVELRNKPKNAKLKDPKDKIKTEKKDPKTSGCTTYNTHRASDGCYWEYLNKGQTCVFDHYCAWCKLNRNVVEKHKSLSCEYKPE